MKLNLPKGQKILHRSVIIVVMTLLDIIALLLCIIIPFKPATYKSDTKQVVM